MRPSSRQNRIVNPELLEILCCPLSRQALRLADEATLDRINQAIAAGRIGRVDVALDAALVRTDGMLAYPVRAGLPVLLASDALSLKGVL
jgi:uncharacterized protein YbaR (Trm112 family)